MAAVKDGGFFLKRIHGLYVGLFRLHVLSNFSFDGTLLLGSEIIQNVVFKVFL